MKPVAAWLWALVAVAAMGCQRSPATSPSQSTERAPSPTNGPPAITRATAEQSDPSAPASNGDTPQTPRERKRPKAEMLVNVVAKLGDPDGPGPGGDAEFQVRRRDGVVKKLFDIELARAKPGEVYKVEIDGVAVGEFTIEEDGQGELEFSNEADEQFPSNFPDLKPGSTIRVGDRFEAKFEPKPAPDAPRAN